jgi:hypothetical protein
LQDFQVRPLTLKLAIRARGTLAACPSLDVQELRKAFPKWQSPSTDADRHRNERKTMLLWRLVGQHIGATGC